MKNKKQIIIDPTQIDFTQVGNALLGGEKVSKKAALATIIMTKGKIAALKKVLDAAKTLVEDSDYDSLVSEFVASGELDPGEEPVFSITQRIFDADKRKLVTETTNISALGYKDPGFTVDSKLSSLADLLPECMVKKTTTLRAKDELRVMYEEGKIPPEFVQYFSESPIDKTKLRCVKAAGKEGD